MLCPRICENEKLPVRIYFNSEVFNNIPNETTYFCMLLNRKNVTNFIVYFCWMHTSVLLSFMVWLLLSGATRAIIINHSIRHFLNCCKHLMMMYRLLSRNNFLHLDWLSVNNMDHSAPLHEKAAAAMAQETITVVLLMVLISFIVSAMGEKNSYVVYLGVQHDENLDHQLLAKSHRDLLGSVLESMDFLKEIEIWNFEGWNSILWKCAHIDFSVKNYIQRPAESEKLYGELIIEVDRKLLKVGYSWLCDAIWNWVSLLKYKAVFPSWSEQLGSLNFLVGLPCMLLLG